MENYIFWSEIGFGEPGGIPPPRNSMSTQPPPPPDLPRAKGSGYAREAKSGIPEIIFVVEFGSWALESGM